MMPSVVVARLIFLISLPFVIYCEVWNSKDFLKKEHSLVKPYNNDDKWILVGSAVKSNTFVRLTPDQQSRKGAIWNTVPCRIKNWELHVHFKVFGSGAHMYGDGFALWYVKERADLGPVFGSKDHFYGLGIFFDTYANQDERHDHGFPYVSFMVNNGSVHYDHDKDGGHEQLGGCESQFRGSLSETYVAIRYENEKLTISLDTDGKNAWKTCVTRDKVKLPTGLYFGASAATGGLSDNHDVISFKLYDIGSGEDAEESLMHIAPSVESSNKDFVPSGSDTGNAKSEWSFAYTFFVVVIVALSVGTTLYLYFQQKHNTNKKRLY